MRDDHGGDCVEQDVDCTLSAGDYEVPDKNVHADEVNEKGGSGAAGDQETYCHLSRVCVLVLG